MKRYFKMSVIVMLVLVCANACVLNVCTALSINVTEPSGGEAVNDKLANIGKKTWSIVVTVLRCASIGLFTYAGVKYMIASADQKADIKKSMIPLIIGTLIVFGGTFVVGFAIKLFKDVAGI